MWVWVSHNDIQIESMYSKQSWPIHMHYTTIYCWRRKIKFCNKYSVWNKINELTWMELSPALRCTATFSLGEKRKLFESVSVWIYVLHLVELLQFQPKEEGRGVFQPNFYYFTISIFNRPQQGLLIKYKVYEYWT